MRKRGAGEDGGGLFPQPGDVQLSRVKGEDAKALREIGAQGEKAASWRPFQLASAVRATSPRWRAARPTVLGGAGGNPVRQGSAWKGRRRFAGPAG